MKFLSIQSLMGQRKPSSRRRRNHAAGGRRPSFAPRLEGLEDRTLLTTISVLNTDDSGPGSLRQAILDANAQEGADTIEFADGVQGTIGLTSGQLAISDDLTIDGPGADVLTVSGSGLSRVFLVNGATVTIDDITIADGLATGDGTGSEETASYALGGGLRNVGGEVTLDNVHVTGNSTQNYVGAGAGVSNSDEASLTVNHSTFSDNQAFGFVVGAGGAISVGSGSMLTVNETTFTGNKALAATGLNPDVLFSGLGNGGAIWGGEGATATITNSHFENNVAKGGDGMEDTGQDAGFAVGGAIGFNNAGLVLDAPSSLHVTGSTFSGNLAIGGSGADGPDGVRGGNGGGAYSGAIHLSGSLISGGVEATIENSEFNGNQAIAGNGGQGGAGADGGESGNYNDVYVGTGSGAVTVDGGTLTVSDSSFSDNLVQGGQGGQGGSGGNGGDSHQAEGGAIRVSAWAGVVPGSLEMTNTTLTNNTVVAGQGGKAGEGGAHDGRDGDASTGGLWALSELGTEGLINVTISDSTVSGNVVQGSSSANTNGVGILADVGATLTLTNVTASDNKQVVDGVETVVDGYGCEGILTADGCVGERGAIVVQNTHDDGLGSLRQAILVANGQEGPDVIQFNEGLQGTIGLTSGQLVITDEVTIDGPGADVLTVSGSGMSRVFLVSGATVTIDDVTIADGLATDYGLDDPAFAAWAAGGGLRVVGGDATLNNVNVVGNTAQNFVAAGAGVSSGFGASLTINGATFEDNRSTGGITAGGAISFGQGALDVSDSTFSGNQAIAVFGLDPDITYSGSANGGAIFGGNEAHLTVTNSHFADNLAKGGDGAEGTGQHAGYATGGAIDFGNFDLTGSGPSTLSIAGSTFSGNQAIGGRGADGSDGVPGGNGGPGFTGAVHIYAGPEATITNSQFTGNQSITGDGGNGGAGADGGESGNYNNTFVGGGTGALAINGGTLILSDSSFADNVVRGGNGGQGGSGGNGGDGSAPYGGAVSVSPWTAGFNVPASLVMTNTTLANNTVIAGYGGEAGDGGGHDGADGEALGGGLRAFSPNGTPGLAVVNATDSTVTGNVVQSSGNAGGNGAGILADIGANVTLTNVTISENKEIADGAEVVVDGFACEGIPTADGCVAAQQGDADRDGDIDMVDFAALAAAFGQEGDWLNGDFDLDGRVDFSDFVLLANNYGPDMEQ